MDEVRVRSRFLKDIVGMIFSRQLTKKLDMPISLALYDFDVNEDVEDAKYIIHLNCNVWISKEDLQKLIWKEQNGSGTS